MIRESWFYDAIWRSKAIDKDGRKRRFDGAQKEMDCSWGGDRM